MSFCKYLVLCFSAGLAMLAGKAGASASIEEFRSRCLLPLEAGQTVETSDLNELRIEAVVKDPLLSRALEGSRLFSVDQRSYIFGVADPHLEGAGCFVVVAGNIDATATLFFEWASSLVAEGKYVWSRQPPITTSPTDNIPHLLSQPPLYNVRMGLVPDPNREWAILIADTVGR